MSKSIADASFGVIPIRQATQGWEVLLINQYSRIGNNTYWILPKGHAEGNEAPLETAARELKEETGLVASELLQTPEFTLQYQFVFEGKKIDKTVTFFIGVIADPKLHIDNAEVKEAVWFPLHTAENRLDYEDTKVTFRQAREYIEENL